jgi:hypothetical protein
MLDGDGGGVPQFTTRIIADNLNTYQQQFHLRTAIDK